MNRYLFLVETSPMDTLKTLINKVISEQCENTMMPYYRKVFRKIVKEIDPEHIGFLLQNNRDIFKYMRPLYSGSLIYRKRYQEAYDFLTSISFIQECTNTGVKNDYFLAKMLRDYHISMKHMNIERKDLYEIRSKLLGTANHYSLCVITNCILDNQINNGIFLDIETPVPKDKEERCRLEIYRGIINLVKGNYQNAHLNLETADILCTNSSTEIKLRKYMIVCSLLRRRYDIFYKFHSSLRPYFLLIGRVKNGDIGGVYSLLDRHNEEYYSMGLYFVIRRLIQTTMFEGFRKITNCYLRIKLDDISRIVGLKANSYIREILKKGVLRGCIKNDVFYSMPEKREKEDLGEKMRKLVSVRNLARDLIKYPAVDDPSYEDLRTSQ